MTTTALQLRLQIDQEVNNLSDHSYFLRLLTSTQSDKIADHVIAYIDKDGAPMLTDYRINNMQYDEASGTGSFRLHFVVARQFCCSDSISCQTDYIDFKFTKSSKTIYLTGNYTYWSTQ
ncbi:hypothetical protein K7A41_18600 [Sphingobacterium sp. InxBP1]|uniref:hypothetical protein n=1 Tax=Sphingobacterium sp. InxBP1 TaxID=2870328 RepID=UPI002242F537|nr:hypothetical protein [Sphingobacterium sp. InxBP1]MCW8313245.1 hypothetical protein [Sphingobacterium sp. InxBP1]